MMNMSTMARLNLMVTTKEVSEMAAAQEEVDRQRVKVKESLCVSNGETKELAGLGTNAILTIRPTRKEEELLGEELKVRIIARSTSCASTFSKARNARTEVGTSALTLTIRRKYKQLRSKPSSK